ncbi:MAG: GNAT family N-acetyltransferase [Acidobacteriota bacterium]
MQVNIEQATADDGPAILRLLSNSALPTVGALDHLNRAMVAREGSRVVGCAVLEVHTEGVLLRSVAVDAAFKGRGVGTRLNVAHFREIGHKFGRWIDVTYFQLLL